MKAASLNHVYRLVWNKLQQAWVAVAETTRSHGKSSVSGQVGKSTMPAQVNGRHVSLTTTANWRMLVVSAFIAAVAPISSIADTNEIAGVIAGDLTVKDISATHTQYTHTANVNIVDFYKFGVMKGHQLDVVMPDAGKALYRVIGNSRSEINGTLNSNGSLFLINQNGVLFGKGSEVNVGNIVASSMNITNDDFLKGNYQFTLGSIAGAVENRGVIKAQNEGYIVLLGNTVDNSGTLVASNGSVVLGSAQQATLDFFGNGLVKAKLSGDALEAAVKNSGFISADGGLVQLATNARSAAINVSGIIEANQLVERDGVIRLEGGDNAKVEVSGQLIAKGQNTTGGTIEVTGEQVALMSGALLDASGDTGGGTVLVGGDYQGKNSAVYNSRTTYISSGAAIKADAIEHGDGGKVIVWADDLTRYYGEISAQGGTVSGNGGFVEVSGKLDLAFQGAVDVGAANGLGGTVLLDPTNIIISTDPQMPIPDQANGTPDVAFASKPGQTTTVNVNSVKGFNELFLQATNDITVNSALTMTKATGSVRLEAGNDINVNANITSGTFGTVKLTANADGVGSGNITIGADITGSAGVTLSAANISHTAGNINTTGNVLGIAGDVKINATGDVNLGTANINANGTTVGVLPGASGGNVTINANSLNMNGNINTAGSASGNGLSSGGQGGTVVINTANDAIVGNITTSSGSAGSLAVVSRLSGTVNITSNAGDISTKNVNTSGGTNGIGAAVALEAKGGSVTTESINTSAGASTIFTQGLSAGSVTVKAADNLKVDTITSNGGNGGSVLNPSGGAAGKIELIATSGNLTMGGVSNLPGVAATGGTDGKAANIFAQAGGDLNLNGNILNGSKTADAVQLVAGGNFKNNADATITTGTGGRWTIYSNDPTNDIKGANLLAAYDYKQYGTKFGGTLLGTGNGFVHAVSPTVTATLTGTATKVFDGNNVVTDLSGLSITTTGLIDGDKVTISPTPITSATYDTAAVGAGKPIDSTFNVATILTNEGKQIFNPVAGTANGYTVVTNSNATGTILAVPPALGFASPRDDAGLGGLIPNNPALNTMFVVSLNPAAGDEEDLDAVACPVNEDSLGSTPILNSGVKLPDGVNSNCI